MNETIAFLGGGNMAAAMIKGLIDAATWPRDRIIVTEIRADRRAELEARFGIRAMESNAEAAALASCVVLAVKPQVAERVLGELATVSFRERLFVSIAAGVTIDAIESHLGADARIVRAMPNTPALVGAAATAIAAGSGASRRDVETAKAIFDAVGMTVVLDESALDAVTGLSGSGPAYVFLVLEALADAGVKVGLHRDSAQRLAAQTLLGSARLLLETGEHPGRLKDMVTSPGGTAIAGLHTLEAGGLRTTLINAVEAATRRARELGEEAARRIKKA